MKTLTTYRPNAIQNAFGDFDMYIESFLGDLNFAPTARIFNRLPSVDIRETENAYVLDMELPGYSEKDIEANVDGSNLTITSKQEEKKDVENEGTYVLRERRLNAFSRSFKLPENADPEAVSAAFKNGVLRLEIKKLAGERKKMIQINAA